MNTLRKLMVGMILAAFSFLAQAGPVTLTKFQINIEGLDPNSGGVGTAYYPIGVNLVYDQSFRVNIKPWQQMIDDTIVSVDDWLTPVIGSDVSFSPVDLQGTHEDSRRIFKTSIGHGYVGETSIHFFQSDTRWEVTQISSQVPEPGSLALLGVALLGLAAVTTRKKNRK